MSTCDVNRLTYRSSITNKLDVLRRQLELLFSSFHRHLIKNKYRSVIDRNNARFSRDFFFFFLLCIFDGPRLHVIGSVKKPSVTSIDYRLTFIFKRRTKTGWRKPDNVRRLLRYKRNGLRSWWRLVKWIKKTNHLKQMR